MIYVNDTQFADLKTQLKTALARLGTGIKPRHADETVAHLLGFADYNTYRALGRLPSLSATAGRLHRHQIADAIRRGELSGRLSEIPDFHHWLLRIAVAGTPDRSPLLVFDPEQGTSAQDHPDFQLWCLLDDAFPHYGFDIVKAVQEGVYSGTLTNQQGHSVAWALECPYLQMATMPMRPLAVLEAALVAQQFHRRYQTQVGSKLNEVLALLLPQTDEATRHRALTLGYDPAPFFQARHRRMTELMHAQAWMQLSDFEQEYEALSAAVCPQPEALSDLTTQQPYPLLPVIAVDAHIDQSLRNALAAKRVALPCQGTYGEVIGAIHAELVHTLGNDSGLALDYLLAALDDAGDTYRSMLDDVPVTGEYLLQLSNRNNALGYTDMEDTGATRYPLCDASRWTLFMQAEAHYQQMGHPVTDHCHISGLKQIGTADGVPVYTLIMES